MRDKTCRRRFRRIPMDETSRMLIRLGWVSASDLAVRSGARRRLEPLP